MLRLSRQFETLIVLAVLAASAWAQTAHYTVPAASVGVDFSSYHQALSNAADVPLANVARETKIRSRIVGVASNDPTEPDATILHDFAGYLMSGAGAVLVVPALQISSQVQTWCVLLHNKSFLSPINPHLERLRLSQM
jgi:hypothetical protein